MRVLLANQNRENITNIPRARVGYEFIVANEAPSADLAIIISYPTSASGKIVLGKTHTK